ncbi:ggtA [Symbiodinium necroappetens]|uniref:GgtA protein n=1 Tax=Symbiodinium necroappetens TaxID=1628268 RepID=A0A812QPH6_9DINO|nr:ggtA [Symbiodinium necroappetens]
MNRSKHPRRYNFKYDFVTYKWPSWLNPQSEKQRLIWAYKILFLDVLFPQDVPKIIFIDADQVVRADVKELWDLDLKGNVYGFVPMGDTNPDTEGFRFWKQGYWKSHLGGKPYHISALFVVDLMEVHEGQAPTVETLFPIEAEALKSLKLQAATVPPDLHWGDAAGPTEWLWCETWCSQESKKSAKTIDLCQNPLTKEPKIVMAKRIISEWQTPPPRQLLKLNLRNVVSPKVRKSSCLFPGAGHEPVHNRC